MLEKFGANVFKSLINKTKNSGPRKEPCGTPEVISVKEDE